MKEEIMKILKMVEEDKIKAEDAYKLIDAIEEYGFNLDDLVSFIQEGTSQPIVDIEGEDEKIKIWIE